MTAERNQ